MKRNINYEKLGMNDSQWKIYEMLKGNLKLNYGYLKKSKKADLINAIIHYISKQVFDNNN